MHLVTILKIFRESTRSDGMSSMLIAEATGFCLKYNAACRRSKCDYVHRIHDTIFFVLSLNFIEVCMVSADVPL